MASIDDVVRGRMIPVAPAERIEVIDVLRGAALFGIIVANMRGFNSPQPVYMDLQLLWTGVGDRIVQAFIDLFVSGKFITLFSYLFGIGFAIQMDRAEARGASPRFYLRRLTVLLLMGLAHMFLLWWGDILTAYALMGFLLFLFRRRTQKTLLIWAAACYAWPLIVLGGVVIAAAAGVPIPHPSKTTNAEIQRIIAIYSAGSYGQMFQQRLHENLFNLLGLIFFYPRVLGLFLAGLWTWRTGIIQNLGEHVALLKRWQKWGLAVGLAGNCAMLAIAEIFHPDPRTPNVLGYVLMVAGSLAVPLLSLFYASTLVLLWREARWRVWLHPFANVGRTALTNYLLQTVLCTFLYNSWGFALYGHVGPLFGLVPTILIYGTQLAVSAWWLRHFAFGPVEWVWRLLTYGRMPTLARRGAAA